MSTQRLGPGEQKIISTTVPCDKRTVRRYAQGELSPRSIAFVKIEMKCRELGYPTIPQTRSQSQGKTKS